MEQAVESFEFSASSSIEEPRRDFYFFVRKTSNYGTSIGSQKPYAVRLDNLTDAGAEDVFNAATRLQEQTYKDVEPTPIVCRESPIPGYTPERYGFSAKITISFDEIGPVQDSQTEHVVCIEYVMCDISSVMPIIGYDLEALHEDFLRKKERNTITYARLRRAGKKPFAVLFVAYSAYETWCRANPLPPKPEKKRADGPANWGVKIVDLGKLRVT